MNSWNNIPLSNYENHMKLDSIYQLQTLNRMMFDQIHRQEISSVMILGVAGGNGLNHISSKKINKVYCVDINSDYLNICKERYSNLNECLVTIRKDLFRKKPILPHADLVIANLIIEYIGCSSFVMQIKNINPQYISIIIQKDTDEKFISHSPYLNILTELNDVHNKIDEEDLTVALSSITYQLKDIKKEYLPNGKQFIQLDYQLQNEGAT